MILLAGKTYAELNLNSAIESLVVGVGQQQPVLAFRYIDITGVSPTPTVGDFYDNFAFYKILATGVDASVSRADSAIITLRQMTPAQARAWVTANVNTLADAKTLLGTMAAILCVLARRL